MKQIAFKLITILLLCTIIYIENSSAQDSIPSLSSKPDNPDNFWRRVSVGGNLGFMAGTVTGITIAPESSIRTVDQLYVGVRFLYEYYYNKHYYYDLKTTQELPFQSNVYGGGIYLRYYLSSLFDNFMGNLFAHIEYEYQTYTQPYTMNSGGNILDPYGNAYISQHAVITTNSIFVGGGYRQPISNRVSMDLLILFNLNDTYNSPYSNPIFRLGIGVGL